MAKFERERTVIRKAKARDEAEELAELAEMKRKAAVRVANLTTRAAAPSVSTLKVFNTRLGERLRGPFPATAHRDRASSVECQVADYSAQGLRLRFKRSVNLPQVVVVECVALGGFIISEVRWQDGAEAGLSIDRKTTRRVRLAMDPTAA